MGKGILLTVGFVLAGVTLLLFGGQRAMLETKDDQGEYQYQAIARDVARSGFEKGVSAIMRDHMDAPSSFGQVAMEGGHYDLTISQNLYGDLVVTSNAEGDEAAYQMEGNVLFTAPLEAAVVLEDINVDAMGSGFYQVSGVDRRMPSRLENSPGFSTPIPGIITTEANRADVQSSFNAQRVIGVGNNPNDPVDNGSVTTGFTEAMYENLYQEAITKSNATISHIVPQITREALFQSALSGSSPGNPKIIRVQGDLFLNSDVQGYGLLIMEDGSLTVNSDDFRWEGLILARKDLDMIDVYGTDTTRINLNQSSLYGGLVAYNVGTPPVIECVPDFDIEGNDTVVSDSFRVRLTVLGAAISYGGDYDMPVTARVHIGDQVFEPWGNYSQALDGNVNTGNSGVTYTWEPDIVFPAGAGVSIDARSWVRDEDDDGTSNSHWDVEMEKNSSVVDSNQEVLEDGNSVPSVGGFMGQYSVVDFLGDYIENDVMTMEDNQTVNLFELGSDDPDSDTFDMQDLVVLVELVDASEGGCQSDGGSTLEFYMRNTSEIHYSSEAIAKLGSRLDAIEAMTSVKVASTSGRGTAEGETAVWADDNTVAADDEEEDEFGGTSYGEEVLICHNGDDEKVIKLSRLAKHISHGDYVGACELVTVCHDGKTRTILENDLTVHLGHGDSEGTCSGDDDDD